MWKEFCQTHCVFIQTFEDRCVAHLHSYIIFPCVSTRKCDLVARGMLWRCYLTSLWSRARTTLSTMLLSPSPLLTHCLSPWGLIMSIQKDQWFDLDFDFGSHSWKCRCLIQPQGHCLSIISTCTYIICINGLRKQIREIGPAAPQGKSSINRIACDVDNDETLTSPCSLIFSDVLFLCSQTFYVWYKPVPSCDFSTTIEYKTYECASDRTLLYVSLQQGTQWIGE